MIGLFVVLTAFKDTKKQNRISAFQIDAISNKCLVENHAVDIAFFAVFIRTGHDAELGELIAALCVADLWLLLDFTPYEELVF